MTIQIINISVTPLQQNCRVLIDEQSKKAVVVDPGGDADVIDKKLKAEGVTLHHIWLTHSHLDHCGGVAGLLRSWPNTPLVGHQIEAEFRSRVEDICDSYGMPDCGMENCPEPDSYINGGDVITFAGQNFEVRFCPGHSPGHLIFYCAEMGVLLAGDTLFAGSIGRTDLPYGDHDLLLSGIKEQIYTLPDNTKVMPGHGPDTTVGLEKTSNPFVRG